MVDENTGPETAICIAVQKANHILGCIKRGMTRKSKEVILLLYCTPVRPHLESCVQLWCPQHKKDVDLLKQFQRRATKLIKRLKHLSDKNVGAVQHGEEKALMRSYSSLPVHKEGLQEVWRGTFHENI